MTEGAAVRFIDRLIQSICEKRTPLVVGLDPHFDLLPPEIQLTVTAALETRQGRKQAADASADFCCAVLDVVAPLVPAVKPQVAFFEQWGPAGMEALRRVVDHAQNRRVLVILDAKRNDIGSTAVAYARAMLGSGDQSAFGGDAVTINPWMGVDSLTPFVERCAETRTGAFVLVKTSNPGSRDFQNLIADTSRLYERVADMVEVLACASLGSCGYGDIGAVVGATYPEELGLLRQRMPHAMFLIPGYGAQGASASDLALAFNPHGLGAIVNSSRGVLFAFRQDGEKSPGGDWQFEVEQATHRAIADLASATPAGNLESNPMIKSGWKA